MSVVHWFSIRGVALPEGADVVAFRGSEAISKPYRFEVFLRVPEREAAGFDPRRVIGQRATLSILNDSGDVRRVVHGMWSSIALARALPHGEALYRAVLSPRLWRLSLSRRSRVFVDRTAPDIVASVLRECGFAPGEFLFRLENERRYHALDHVCQYRESNLDFVSRRLEHDGIYYYFEHPEDGSAERLVITDSISFAEPLSRDPVRFLASDDQVGVEGLHSLSCVYAAVPSGARTFGHNYLNPRADVGGEAVDAPDDPFVVHSWEPSRTDAEGRHAAQVRAEEVRARESVLEGTGRCFDVRAGYTFEVDDHPMLAGEYLATEVQLRGCDLAADKALAKRLGFSDVVFEVDVTAIPGDVQFRPERATPRPRVHGTELGIVRGPAESPYAQVDEHGRYLVQLMLDDDRAKVAPSTRMRMAQPHAGANGAGMHFPLRNGAEVLVSFVRGDPDSPVIASVVPNAESPSPVTEENASKNVIQTGGGNRMVIEDREGHEYVKWTTPHSNTRFHIGAPHNPQHNFELYTDGNGLIRTGAGVNAGSLSAVDSEDTRELPTGAQDLMIQVGANKTEYVNDKVIEEYGPLPTNASRVAIGHAATHTERVYGDRNSAVTGTLFETIGSLPEALPTLRRSPADASAKHQTTVNGSVSRDIYGNHTEHVRGAQSTAVDGPRSVSVSHALAPDGSVITGDLTTTVDGAVTETYRGGQTTNITGDWNVTCDSKTEIVTGENAHHNYGDTQVINAGGNAQLNAAANLQLNFAVNLSLSFAISLNIWDGMCVEAWLGTKTEVGKGMKIESYNLKTNSGIGLINALSFTVWE